MMIGLLTWEILQTLSKSIQIIKIQMQKAIKLFKTFNEIIVFR